MLKFIAKKSPSLRGSETFSDFIDNLDSKLSSRNLENFVAMLNKYYSRIKCSEHPDSNATVEIEYMGLGKKKMAFYLSDCCCTTFDKYLKEKLNDAIDRQADADEE